MILLWFCLACAPAPSPFPANSQQSTTTVDEDSAIETTLDSAEEVPERFCSAGTVPVPDGFPQFCIMSCEAAFFEEQAISEVGVYPATNISFYRAQELCENTTVQGLGASMRLPTVAEWLDAGDGIYGEGGSVYPWGNSFHNGECVLPTDDNVWSSAQVCGSLSSCQSPFGVWDQIGNLWEWVDSEQRVDIERWFAAREAEGLILSRSNGVLQLDAGTLSSFLPFAVGLF